MNKTNINRKAQKIRAQYTEKKRTELDELCALDAKVKRPANVFAYVFGSLAAIVMGCGMSLVMTTIGETLGIADPMTYGIIIGTAGLILAAINYPIYKGILGSRKKKYAARILEISKNIIDDPQ